MGGETEQTLVTARVKKKYVNNLLSTSCLWGEILRAEFTRKDRVKTTMDR